MKKSKKYLIRSLLTMHGAVVLFVGISSAFEDGNTEFNPARTSAEVLATLENFDTIQTRGNLELVITRQDQFQISYSPQSSILGTFSASLEGNTLIIEGHNNGNSVEGRGRLEIGMPALTLLNAVRTPTISLSGFDQDVLNMDIDNVRSISINQSNLNSIQLEARTLDELRLVGSVVASRSVKVSNLRSVGFNLIEE